MLELSQLITSRRDNRFCFDMEPLVTDTCCNGTDMYVRITPLIR